MSKCINNLLKTHKGYDITDYSDNELSSVLNFEMIELGNIDIPYYLHANKIISDEQMKKFEITDNEFELQLKYNYNSWLKANNIVDNSTNVYLFRDDCNMRKVQSNASEIIKLIVSILKEKLSSENIIVSNFIDEKPSYIYTKMEPKNLPDNFVILTDMDESGALFAYNQV